MCASGEKVNLLFFAIFLLNTRNYQTFIMKKYKTKNLGKNNEEQD